MPIVEYVLFSETFSGYFSKEESQGKRVDATMDVRLFGEEIAPHLGIRVRFVGEEPLDTVTKQYNEAMKRILPTYGIQVVEIPRKMQGDTPISASSVRRLLEKGAWDEIEKLVPEMTFVYLKNRADKSMTK